MSDKVNFLYLITDQHRADYLSCVGHPVLKTPHIDRIADGGTRFDRFYVANPVCMPNRSTLITGRMTSINGVRHNGHPLPANANTFLDVLRAEGYATAIAKTFDGISLHMAQRQLERFERAGALVSTLKGRTRLYTWNARYPFLKELRALLARGLEALPAGERKRYFSDRSRPRPAGKPV